MAPDDVAVGYRLERQDAPGAFHAVNKEPLPGNVGCPNPAWYSVADNAAGTRGPFIYRVVTLAADGTELAGPAFELNPDEAGVPTTSLSEAPAEQPSSPPVSVAQVAGARMKIAISATGLYALTASNIAACLEGYDTSAVVDAIAARTLSLSCAGAPVAWTPSPDGTSVWFVGVSTPGIYSTQTVYWLEGGAGLVMSHQSGTAAVAGADGTFTDRVHVEGHTYYVLNVYTDPTTDNWYWAYVRSGTNATFVLNLPGATAAGATLTANLKGATERDITLLEHHARIRVNGEAIGTADWGRLEAARPAFAVTNLVDGTNTVVVEGLYQAGDPALAAFLVESFDVTCERRYQAAGDSLFCAGGTNPVVTIGGFGGPDIRLYDVSDVAHPVAIDGIGAEASTDGTWRISFVPATPTNRYLAVRTPREPDATQGRPVATWGSATHGADHVIITHASLRDAATAWSNYRNGQGTTSVVVDVEDLYDEFAQGRPTPYAIRDFIAAALGRWARPPRFVMLLGAGNYDYRNILKMPAFPCLVPPAMVATPFGLFGTDAPLADVDGDHVPDIALGRIPVVSTNEALALLAKTMAFEGSAPQSHRLTGVADVLDAASGGYDFAGASDALLPRVPAAYSLDADYQSATQSVSQVRTRLLAALNEGRSTVTYVGHGATSQLGLYGILQPAHLSALTNSGTAPVLLAMTCQFGHYAFIITGSSLAEQLLRKANGGFSAIWACASSSVNADNVQAGDWMLRALFRRPGMKLGPAHVAAMAGYAASSGAQPYVLDTYVLLGDPALDAGVVTAEPGSWAAWQQASFTPEQQADAATSGPDADPDGDGSPNAAEYEAGTRPLDAGSCLAVTSLAATGTHWQVSWASATNRLYAVEAASQVGGPYTALVRRVWAEPPMNRLADLVERGTGLFYRVRTDD